MRSITILLVLMLAVGVIYSQETWILQFPAVLLVDQPRQLNLRHQFFLLRQGIFFQSLVRIQLIQS